MPFGVVEILTGASASHADIRFPGQWFQSEHGLHQNWMRDYDPVTGRYLQADPPGLVDGASIYGYALQNPIGFIDFYGMEASVIDGWWTEGYSTPSIGGVGRTIAGVCGRFFGGVVTMALWPSPVADATCSAMNCDAGSIVMNGNVWWDQGTIEHIDKEHGTGWSDATRGGFPENWTSEDIEEWLGEVANGGVNAGAGYDPDSEILSGEHRGVGGEIIVYPDGEIATGYPTYGSGIRGLRIE